MPTWKGQPLSRNAGLTPAGRDHMNGQEQNKGSHCHLQNVSRTVALESWPEALEKWCSVEQSRNDQG